MDRRVLILAPHGRDATVISDVLSQHAVEVSVCLDPRGLLMEMDRGAGAAVLTEEGVSDADLPAFRRWLDEQPSWADFPFIVLARSNGTDGAVALHHKTAALGNVVVLERPVNAETLSSAVASALRARDRQYQARRSWVDRENDDRRLRIALIAGNLAAWNFDCRDRSLQASDRLEALFGRQRGTPMREADLLAAIHPDDQETLRLAFEAGFERQADISAEARVIRPDGSLRWLQFTGRTIYGDDGRPATLSGVALDVTERREADDELQRRVADAVEQNQRAQLALVQAQKMEAVGQLTGGIAHDFNNLLTAIVGNIDLISRRAPDERIKTMASRARQAADRAAKLTGQLLAFSRSQRLDLRPVQIDRLLSGMRDLVARTIGPTIVVQADLKVPNRVAVADGNQLELAVLNLAINARDAMPSGGRLIIETRAERGDQGRGWLVVAITDTGTGIAPEILPRVFDPFFTTKPVGKGTGLGLSQVHGIAHQSGGSVKIRSALGQGTTIEIWLRETDPAQQAVDEGPGDGDALVPGSGHVLVIDDDADVRRFVVEGLEILGFSVTQAGNGRDGLARLDQDRPDLLIVDFAMPGLNGAEVAVTARDRYPTLPIILVTGYAETSKVESIFRKESILRKPFRLPDLSWAVRHALQTS